MWLVWWDAHARFRATRLTGCAIGVAVVLLA